MLCDAVLIFANLAGQLNSKVQKKKKKDTLQKFRADESCIAANGTLTKSKVLLGFPLERQVLDLGLLTATLKLNVGTGGPHIYPLYHWPL